MTPGSISVSVPWLGQKKTAAIYGGKWTGDAILIRAFGYIHLSPGHHGDRDLELAMLAIKYFGGSMNDQRPSPLNLHRLPK
jgi:hypothetical protein